MPLVLASDGFAQHAPPAAAAAAEIPTGALPPTTPDAQKTQRQKDLDAVLAGQRQAADIQARLKAEVDAIGEDRRKLSQALIDTAARIRALEGRVADSEGRLKTLDDNERTIRDSLASRRAVIAEVLAALQRIGHRPPPAVLVRPEDALQSVRTALMLGAVLPDMRAEAAMLAADLGDLIRVRDAIMSERVKSAADLGALSQDRQRMTLLVEERQKSQIETERALDAERERATALAREADGLKDLIAKLEQDISAAARAAEAAARADAAARDASAQPASPPPANSPPSQLRQNFAALNDPGRLSPGIAFASAKGRLQLPVNGPRLREFGSPDRLGSVEKGLSIAARAAAQVTAPCDGWVVYAGPFRSYGQLLILNAGGGYHVLLAGMERISVSLGQFVLTGEPVAVMGNGSKSAALVPLGSGQSVLYVEFRKDGTPVDPSPWWATNDSEKVRG